MKTVLVTGASGFIGRRFVELCAPKYALQTPTVRLHTLNDIDFSGVDTVLHMAGQAHSMTPLPDEIYYESNSRLTQELAQRAVAAGVSHFIFMSTVNVFQTEASVGLLNEHSPRLPDSAYGRSKKEAEDNLVLLASASFAVTVIRPALVYGPGAKGNLLRLLQLAESPWPLPFKDVRNARSMVSVDNLVALTEMVIDKQAAGNFFATDDAPISTEFLVRSLRRNLRKPPRLFKLPWLFSRIHLVLRPSVHRRLFGSFTIDNTATRVALGFKPPHSIEQGLKSMTDSYLLKKQNPTA
jgi:nucleoside-diphosphate-sugar epimerase